MKRALIHKPTNRFVQRGEPGADFPVHADLEWRDCPDDVRPETHDFDGTNFIPHRPDQFHEWDGERWAIPADRAREVHNTAIDQQISAKERPDMAPRWAREATLVGIAKDYMRDHSVDFARAVANLTNPAHGDYSHGFTKLKALDDEIRALRAQRLP